MFVIFFLSFFLNGVKFAFSLIQLQVNWIVTVLKCKFSIRKCRDKLNSEMLYISVDLLTCSSNKASWTFIIGQLLDTIRSSLARSSDDEVI